MRNWQPLAHSTASAATAVLTELALQYPHWTWVPVAAGVMSMINLYVLPNIFQAYIPIEPAVTLPKEPSPSVKDMPS